MPSDGTNSTSSSVSPKVIVPSVTVISLLVLIIFIGAVTIFVRAYRKRRRHSPNVEKQDAEVGQAGGWGMRNHGRRGSLVGCDRSLPGAPSRLGGVIRSPPLVAGRESKSLWQEAREIVDHGFHDGRGSLIGAGGIVAAGQGYTIRHARETRGTEIYESSGITALPIIGKIERITGNTLSNDFYTDRASGSGHSRSNSASTSRESKRHSYPQFSTRSIPFGQLPSRNLTINANLSQISPEIELSIARDSTYSELTTVFGSLSPPPAVPSAIALKYPNVTTLVRDNQSAESSKRSSNRSLKSPNRFSYTQLYSRTNLTEHVSTQYDSLKGSPKFLQSSPEDVTRAPDSPLSAAFSSLSATLKPLRHIRVSSASTTISLPTEPTDKNHSHRASWSGRSVLELDSPVSNNELSPPPPIPLQSKRHVLRRIDRKTPPEPVTFPNLPRASTSAFGSRRYKENSPVPPESKTGLKELTLPTLLPRSASNSKLSVISVPSTVSSFDTAAGRAVIGGLSPAPARHSLHGAPDSEDVASSFRKSLGSNTVLTHTSGISNMTEAELESEMKRIRERAKRASDEQRSARRREEERQRRRRGAESSLVIGHRFF